MTAHTNTQLDQTSFDSLLESGCKELDRIGRELAEFAVGYMESIREVQQAHRKRAADLRHLYTTAQVTLQTFIGLNKHQFDKPRTRSILGVEVGLRLSAERCEFEFEEGLTLELIDTTLPADLAKLVAPTTRSIMLAAIKKLSDQQRHDIGVRLTSADQIVCKHTADKALAQIKELAQ